MSPFMSEATLYLYILVGVISVMAYFFASMIKEQYRRIEKLRNVSLAREKLYCTWAQIMLVFQSATVWYYVVQTFDRSGRPFTAAIAGVLSLAVILWMGLVLWKEFLRKSR